MNPNNIVLAEFNSKPSHILVHDPVAFKALDNLKGISQKASQELFLFRDLPKEEIFSDDHRKFVNTIKSRSNSVLYLTDALNEDDCQEFQFELSRNPNLVYTRDAVLSLPWLPSQYIKCSMGRAIRLEEGNVVTRALDRLGYSLALDIPESHVLEGGDVIPYSRDGERILLVGYGRRTTENTLSLLRDELISNLKCVDTIVGIKLAEWRINLDGGMVPVNEKTIVAHPPSLLSGTILTKNTTRTINPLDYLSQNDTQIIPVSQDESLKLQACNSFCVEPDVIISYDLVPWVPEKLRELGATVLTVPGNELVKGTGGPRCMTRPMY